MFSKLILLVGTANAAATNKAWTSSYNLNPLTKVTVDTKAAHTANFQVNTGAAHDIAKSMSSATGGYGCVECISAGYDFVPKTTGLWWHQYEPAGAALTTAEKAGANLEGYCCTPRQLEAGANVYEKSDHGTPANRGCGGTATGAVPTSVFSDTQTMAATWNSYAKFNSPDVAIMACPTNKKAAQECGGKTTIDFDATGAAVSQEILVSGTMKAWNSCTFILKSKCKAPTFSVITGDTAKTAPESSKLIRNLFTVRYLEYDFAGIQTGQDYIAENTQFSKMSDIVSEPEKYLGGDMFPLSQASMVPEGYTVASWTGTQMVPGNLVATWIQEKKAQYTAWQNMWKAASTYDNAVQLWNYVHQVEGWKKASFTTDGTAGTTAKPKWDEAAQKTKYDALLPVLQKWDATAKKMVADTAGTKGKLQIEKPMVPPMPMAYNGPSMASTANTAADKLTVVSGFGKKVSGLYKAALPDAAGSGETFQGAKSFGVRGQGNLKPDPAASAAGSTLAGSDHLWSMIEPVQVTTAANCVAHYVLINVQGNNAQTTTNKLGLAVKASEWDTRSLAAPAAPSAIPAGQLPLMRGAKYLAATGAAILSLAAALY